jgi:hypothetical protein
LYIYLEPGNSTSLTITLANPYNADICAVWIDWNGNGDFTDPGENVYLSEFGQGPYNTNITAPEDALQNVQLRMRIRIDYNNPAPDPCGTTSFGEVEDYAIIVSGAQLNPPTNLILEVVSDDFELSWNAPEGKDLLGYNIYHSFNLADFEVLEMISETSYLFEAPELGSHRFYVTAAYDDGESIPSNMVEAIVSPPAPPTNLEYELVNGDIDLSWNAPDGKDLQGYNIFYSFDQGDFELLENVTETTYIIEGPGMGSHRYYITAVYDEGESEASNTVEVLISGVFDNEAGNVNIYPNPLTSKATLEFPNPENENYSLILTNINGKTVRAQNNITDGKIIIEKRNLRNGIYFIELRGHKTFRAKILIE